MHAGAGMTAPVGAGQGPGPHPDPPIPASLAVAPLLKRLIKLKFLWPREEPPQPACRACLLAPARVCVRRQPHLASLGRDGLKALKVSVTVNDGWDPGRVERLEVKRCRRRGEDLVVDVVVVARRSRYAGHGTVGVRFPLSI